jgi:hypothetical protein
MVQRFCCTGSDSWIGIAKSLDEGDNCPWLADTTKGGACCSPNIWIAIQQDGNERFPSTNIGAITQRLYRVEAYFAMGVVQRVDQRLNCATIKSIPQKEIR